MFPPKDDSNFFTGIETQMMASMLQYGVQFLDYLADGATSRLATELARDMRSAQTGPVSFDQERLVQLTQRWFDRGRIYEIIPADALDSTEEIGRSATRLFLEPIPLPMAKKAVASLQRGMVELLGQRAAGVKTEDAICRMFWLWFQWGRSYQKGNPPAEHPLPN